MPFLCSGIYSTAGIQHRPHLLPAAVCWCSVQVMAVGSPDDEPKLVREIMDSGFRRALEDGVKHDPA